MKKTKIGLIGLGYIGKVHLYNCLKMPTAELVAVADVSKKALDSAKKYGVKKTYNDYKDLLCDPEIEAAIIALPTHLHASSAMLAAENNKSILLEKPLARNTTEGKEILAKAEKHGTKIMIGHTSRFSALNRTIKDQIENYELGEIQVAHAVNIGSGPFVHRVMSDAPQIVPEWWWKKEFTGGGALIDLGSHMINMLRWFFGDVTDAKGYLGYRYNLEQEDHAVCTLKFKSGPVAVVNVGWFSQQSNVKVELFGTAGHVTSAVASPGKVKTALQLMMRKTPSYYEPYFGEIQHFIECVQNGNQPQPSGYDALEDLRTIELVYANSVKLS